MEDANPFANPHERMTGTWHPALQIVWEGMIVPPILPAIPSIKHVIPGGHLHPLLVALCRRRGLGTRRK